MGHLIEILLVDDNPADIRIMQEALRDARVANRLHAARDGVECMAFLRREGAFKDAPRPDLILLDLNMPRKGGMEVLAEIKGDPDLRGIPTVILTSSKEEGDVARSYELQANGYVVKPVDLDDFIEVVGGIEEFWVGVVKLPKKGQKA
ncbi:MAG TPA: response regulator [Candidatus Thermoplasmatota archaeon]|nr:response regulator [Candidatus Thermoplasmatota archaeon]